MKNLLAKIIPAIIFLIVIAGSIALAIIGFFIFWYILIFTVIIGSIFYIYSWIRYKITGKKPTYSYLKNAMQKASKHNKKFTKKRHDYSKSDNPNKETIDHEDID